MDKRAQDVVLPWTVFSDDGSEHLFIVDAEDTQVVRFHKCQSEVATRVIACVNACRGISTEDLLTSDFGEDSVEVGAILGQTMQQLDDLQNALNTIMRDYVNVHGVGDLEMQPALNQAQAAIAKASHANASDSEGGHCD